jgi:Pal1 cell morphology protein
MLTKQAWHHDGPFDACRPHRNRKKDALAPINAFPVNSANNTIGGSGPVNAGINLEQFHGTGAEGFNDFSRTGYDDNKMFPKMKALQTHVVNPVNRVEPIHGHETLGLGTSTFLEGAPASRQAIQRTQSEQAANRTDDGLSRTKSLAVRLRAMSTSKRYNDDNRPRPGGINSDRGNFQERSGGVSLTDNPLPSPSLLQVKRPSTSAGSKRLENNPLESLAVPEKRTSYDEAYDKKGATIKSSEVQKTSSPPARSPPMSPGRGLVEQYDDNIPPVPASPPPEPKSLGNSLLTRMKSLKAGPKRTKSERNPS